jgi:ligand-binding SRPBCC domain-containing protein
LPTFIASSLIDAPIEKVFAFHERPDAFQLLTPPDAGVEIVRREGGLAVGAETLVRVPLIPLGKGFWRVNWLARHTEFDPSRLFVDEQVSGPFRYWRHEHRMEAEGAYTRLTDHITFRLPGGFLADFLFAPFVRLQLRAMFSFRHMMTKNYCE